jgi:hypothetical protein
MGAACLLWRSDPHRDPCGGRHFPSLLERIYLKVEAHEHKPDKRKPMFCVSPVPDLQLHIAREAAQTVP